MSYGADKLAVLDNWRAGHTTDDAACQCLQGFIGDTDAEGF